MTNEIVTVDTILNYLQEKIEQKEPIAPTVYVEAAQKLNVLLSDEHDLLFSMQQGIAKKKVELLSREAKRNVSAVKLMIEATDEYLAMRMQEAKIGRIEEFIRIAKIQARVRETEMRGY